MGNIAQLIAKIVFASTVSMFLCVNAGMYSYAAHIEKSIDEIEAGSSMAQHNLGQSSPIDEGDNTKADGIAAENGNNGSSAGGSANADDRNVAPDGVPAAIGQSDGGMYTYQEEIVGEDGNKSYVYSSEENVTFNDGGLGDAELIVN